MKEFTLFASEAGSDQLYLTAGVGREAGPAEATADKICAAVASALDSSGMRILSERVFGALDFYEPYSRIRGEYRDFAQRPFSYVQGMPVHGRGLSGIQIHAVKSFSDDNPRILYDGERPCGSVWKRKDTAYVHLTGIHGFWNGGRSRQEQAAAMFESMRRILSSRSVDFRSVVRTWFFLADVLEWYDKFNAVRTDRFKTFGLIPRSSGEPVAGTGCLPASTGIGGRNPAGASCCGDCLAVSGDVRVSELSGMLQPSAYSYGSAFSRGICVEENDCRQVFVSGTAAIDAMGRSLFPQNAEAQIVKTLEVVEALIGERGATFKDIRSATVYLKRAEDWKVYEKLAGRLGLADLPAVFVVADICRKDLLFEMDAFAVLD